MSKLLTYAIAAVIAVFALSIFLSGIIALAPFFFMLIFTIVAATIAYAIYTEKAGRRLLLVDRILGITVPATAAADFENSPSITLTIPGEVQPTHELTQTSSDRVNAPGPTVALNTETEADSADLFAALKSHRET
jgi:hypothetical protein